ncbi:MAG: 8-oxo-dGTP diphosphatase MutT [Limisphaerales bacterium]
MSSHASRNTHHVVEVAAGLLFRDGQLLITQRHADAHLGGLWEFPGGKREPGETFPECLRRELREELGCEVTVGERLDTIRHDYPDKSVLLEFFACRLKEGEPRPLGCAALRWVTREELAQFPFPAADARLLERVRGDTALWG